MTATFWTGSSLSFTNGSKTVTVNTGPSLDSVKANSSLTAGNYNEPVEVKSVSGNTITLYNNWPGSTGTTSATIKPSAAAAASAGVAAQQLITDIQSLVSSASATATANSFVKRDSNGRIKAASPSANDDVVTKGYLGSAATKNVGMSPGDILTVGTAGAGGLAPSVLNAHQELPSGFYSGAGSSAENYPPNMGYGVFLNAIRANNNAVNGRIYIGDISGTANAYIGFSNDDGQSFDHQELYSSGNTNFNSFGGAAGDNLGCYGFAVSTTVADFYFPLVSKAPPTGRGVVGTFDVVTPDGTLIAAGVTPSFNGRSSFRELVLQVSGLSGITKDQPLKLRCKTATDKITAQF